MGRRTLNPLALANPGGWYFGLPARNRRFGADSGDFPGFTVASPPALAVFPRLCGLAGAMGKVQVCAYTTIGLDQLAAAESLGTARVPGTFRRSRARST